MHGRHNATCVLVGAGMCCAQAAGCSNPGAPQLVRCVLWKTRILFAPTACQHHLLGKLAPARSRTRNHGEASSLATNFTSNPGWRDSLPKSCWPMNRFMNGSCNPITSYPCLCLQNGCASGGLTNRFCWQAVCPLCDVWPKGYCVCETPLHKRG